MQCHCLINKAKIGYVNSLVLCFSFVVLTCVSFWTTIPCLWSSIPCHRRKILSYLLWRFNFFSPRPSNYWTLHWLCGLGYVAWTAAHRVLVSIILKFSAPCLSQVCLAFLSFFFLSFSVFFLFLFLFEVTGICWILLNRMWLNFCYKLKCIIGLTWLDQMYLV